MKYLLIFFLSIVLCLSVSGQSIDQMQFDGPINACGSCTFGNYNYQTGISIGFGYG